MVATSPKFLSPIYLVPTDDRSVTAFFMNLSAAELKKIKEGKLNQFIYEVFNDSIKNQVENDELWIPSFKKSLNFHNVKVEVEDE